MGRTHEATEAGKANPSHTKADDERTCQYCGKAEDKEGGIWCADVQEFVQEEDTCSDWIPIVGSEQVDSSGQDVDKDDDSETPDEGNARPSETKKIDEYLKYTFTQEEKEELVAELATNFERIEGLRNQKKEYVKSLDSDISKLDERIRDLSECVKKGYQYRNVECEVHYDYATRLKTTVRLDTDEEVKVIPMTADELQRELEFGKG